MNIIPDYSDNDLLCPSCLTRSYFCEAELNLCDCCSCMPNLCTKTVDQLKTDPLVKEVEYV